MILIINLSGCGKSQEPQSISGFYFDTFISISLYSDENVQSILDGCMNLCEHYDKLFNVSDKNSDIYLINHAKGNPVSVDKDTLEIVEKAINYSKETDGLFDITINSAYSLWNFENNDECLLPDDELLQNAVNKIDYRNVIINKDDCTIRLENEAQINLGALAKGYIADKLKKYLVNEGITSGLINLGGNVLAIGSKPDGSDYHIGLQRPFASTGEIIKDISVSDLSVVTSGIYQRYFEADNMIYHHILDPFTGYPVENELNSVTIICSSSLDADAYSTICMLMGYEDGRNFINSCDDVKAIFIDRNNNILP